MRRFYDRGRDGVPRQWVEMVLQAWASLGPQVTAARMVRDYTTALYEPAAASSIHLSADGAKPAVELAAWRKRVEASWEGVAITSVDVDATAATAGATRGVTVTATLGGLTPADVRVEVVHGLLGHDGEFLDDVNVAELQPAGSDRFIGEITIGVAGSYGVSARIIPVHPDLASRFDVGRLAWAL